MTKEVTSPVEQPPIHAFRRSDENTAAVKTFDRDVQDAKQNEEANANRKGDNKAKEEGAKDPNGSKTASNDDDFVVVKSGNTLRQIAIDNNISMSDLYRLNPQFDPSIEGRDGARYYPKNYRPPEKGRDPDFIRPREKIRIKSAPNETRPPNAPDGTPAQPGQAGAPAQPGEPGAPAQPGQAGAPPRPAADQRPTEAVKQINILQATFSNLPDFVTRDSQCKGAAIAVARELFEYNNKYLRSEQPPGGREGQFAGHLKKRLGDRISPKTLDRLADVKDMNGVCKELQRVREELGKENRKDAKGVIEGRSSDPATDLVKRCLELQARILAARAREFTGQSMEEVTKLLKEMGLDEPRPPNAEAPGAGAPRPPATAGDSSVKTG